MKDKVEICGTYKLLLMNPGKPPVRAEGKNRVVTQGLEKIAELMMSATTQPEWMGLGDSTDAVAMTQTGLIGTEWQRVQGTQARVGNAYTLSASFAGVTANRAVAEMGIFSASTGANLFARFLPAEFTLEVGGELFVDWQLEFS